MILPVAVASAGALVIGAGVLGRPRRRVLARLRAASREFEEKDNAPVRAEDVSRLRRWLIRAGLGDPRAANRFLVATALATCLGVVGFVLVLPLAGDAIAVLLGSPIQTFELFVPIVFALPLAIALGTAASPWLWVRRRRQGLVRSVEEDMPVHLELLATMGEAGLGFDGAIEKILSSEPEERVLVREFRRYRAETVAGATRIEALRRMAWRLDVGIVDAFVGAMVQAERVGIGLADVLHGQAEDMRVRRRERALMFAQGLPVKLVFPLVICFLPAIFVLTLGPVFFSFLRITETVVESTK